MKKGSAVTAVITGKAVKFVVAEELGYASNDDGSGNSREGMGRYTYMEVIRTSKGKYVSKTAHISRWENERSHYVYELYDSLKDLVAGVDATDPLVRELLDDMDQLEAVSEEV